ncbi:MAG: CRTAC1 family protein [Gaiellaceae bacterium]
MLRRLPVLLIVVASAASTAASALAEPRAGATVSLAAVGRTQVPQGLPFTFRATISGTATPTAEVEFALVREFVGAVSAASELVVVPAGLSTELERSLTPSQWFPQLGKFQVVAHVGGRPTGKPLEFEVVKSRREVPVFRDVTAALGLTTDIGPGTCSRFISGAAWADVNRDGRADLFTTRLDAPAKLYVQGRGGTFTEEAGARGVAGYGAVALGAVFADYDNDGDPDLYVTNDGPNVLYRNEGDGRFTDVTAASGLAAGPYMHMSGSWADYDNDGWLDLYVTTHSHCVRGDILLYVQDPDQLFHNNRDGTFTDVSAQIAPDVSATPDVFPGAGFQAAWFDYDANGRQDLFLANDYVGARPDRNRMWRNDGPRGDGTWAFTDVSISAGVSLAMNSMGIGVADYDRDLDLDLAVTNIEGNKLLRNNGDGTFGDVSRVAGVRGAFQRANRPSVTWGALFGDLNLDAWEDLYVGAGYLIDRDIDDLGSVDTPQHNQVFVNNADGSFLDLSAPSRADDSGQSRGIAASDYDRDGDLDLYVVNQGGTPRLYRNVTPRAKRHWLEVNTVGTRSNRDGCGARLVVTLRSGFKLLREVFCGSVSVGSGSDKVVHFGLGSTRAVTRLEVTWPSGLKQTFRNVKLDRRLTVTEPKV